MRAAAIPGAEIAVVQGDRVIFSAAFGVAEIEDGTPLRPGTLFRLGSTTKMFTAAAVVGLALEGRVDLQQPVGRYIAGLDPAIGQLTAHQLLSHTSGLADDAVMHGAHDDAALGAQIRAWKPDRFFAPPGRIYSYSNPGYWLAGLLAETVAGKWYGDVVETRILRPLGMERSTFRPTMAMTWPLAQGHDERGSGPGARLAVLRPAADNAANWPAGSLFSNAHELARWVIALLNGGRIEGKQVLPAELIAALMKPHAAVPGGVVSYGYGLMSQRWRGVEVVEHGGSRAGYGSHIGMVPSARIGVIEVANRSGATLPRTRERILEMLLPLEAAAAPRTGGPLAPEEVTAWAGVYRNGADRVALQAVDGKLVRDGQVLVKTGGQAIAAAPDGARMVMVTGADGRAEYVHTGGRSFRRVE